jgi:hypothetical protein
MRDPEQTIGNLIDKQGVAFISSIDSDGFPNMKAMLPPREREGIKRDEPIAPKADAADECPRAFVAVLGIVRPR